MNKKRAAVILQILKYISLLLLFFMMLIFIYCTIMNYRSISAMGSILPALFCTLWTFSIISTYIFAVREVFTRIIFDEYGILLKRMGTFRKRLLWDEIYEIGIGNVYEVYGNAKKLYFSKTHLSDYQMQHLNQVQGLLYIPWYRRSEAYPLMENLVENCEELLENLPKNQKIIYKRKEASSCN